MNSALIAPENIEELAHGGQSRDAAVVVELTAEEKESVGSGLDAALGSLDHWITGSHAWLLRLAGGCICSATCAESPVDLLQGSGQEHS